MPNQYRVCIIGCGRMGGTIDEEVKGGPNGALPYSHAAGYTACERTNIVAAADVVEEKAKYICSKWNIPKRYADYGGAAIPSNSEFQLAFDQGVTGATINGGPTTGSGLNWSGPAPGLATGQTATLNIEWTNRDGTTGSKTAGPFTIEDPDEEAPAVADGTVNDGDDAVDPAAVNAGGIKINFNEDVTGSIKLTLEDGTDNKWSGNVAGRTASLTVVAGQELANETGYKVEVDVTDGSGNQTKLTISFTTKPKD